MKGTRYGCPFSLERKENNGKSAFAGNILCGLPDNSCILSAGKSPDLNGQLHQQAWWTVTRNSQGQAKISVTTKNPYKEKHFGADDALRCFLFWALGSDKFPRGSVFPYRKAVKREDICQVLKASGAYLFWYGTAWRYGGEIPTRQSKIKKPLKAFRFPSPYGD